MIVLLAFAVVLYLITESAAATVFLLIVLAPEIALVWCIAEYLKSLHRTH